MKKNITVLTVVILFVLSITMNGACAAPRNISSLSTWGTGQNASYGNIKLSYPVVDTGQTKCYDNTHEIESPAPGEAFYGQDAQYASIPMQYVDNGDGTITDSGTGLMWQKDPGVKVTWDEAMKGASKLDIGGYTDWRVPSIKELYSLMNFDGMTGTGAENSTPYIDTDYFDFYYGDTSKGERFIDCQYWSSTEYKSTTMNGNPTVFGVNFADGRIKGYPKLITSQNNTSNKLYVRYVRGSEDYGKNNFVDNGDGTITDLATGLMWMKDDSGFLKAGENGDGRLNWEQSLGWAENLDYAGYSDWRLPNAKELQSIVDYTRSPDTTKSAAIDPVFNISSITDLDGNKNYPYFWTGTTHLEGQGGKASQAVYVAFGEAEGYMQMPPNSGKYVLMDVHGAGAQRSDPKAGDPKDYPHGFGPQGDVRTIYNFTRCVRSADMDTSAVQPDAPGDSREQDIKAESGLSAVLIGTGGVNSTSERASSSTLIGYNGHYFLVDMGNGAQQRLEESGIKENQIETLMFTHHHQDHDADYMGILTRGWLTGRDHLNLIGPPGTEKLHEMYVDFYKEDLEYRAGRDKSWDGMTTNVDIKEASGNSTFDIDGVKITTTDVPHSIASQAYRFDAGGKSIVVSGDLTYSYNLIELAQNADILIIDSGAVIKENGTAKDRDGQGRNTQGNTANKPAAVNTGNKQSKSLDGGSAHPSLEDIANMAQKAGVKGLVLVHINGNIDEEGEKEAINKIFDGEVIVGQDLMHVLP